MHTKQMTVTPELAKQFLIKNTNNRTVRRGAVLRLIDDMKSGNFMLMPHGIAFLEDGTLGDGQHRLLAIAESGTTQEMMVTFMMPAECMLNQDRGVGRTEGDNMGITGRDWATPSSLSVLKLMATGKDGKAVGNSFSAAQILRMATPDVLSAIELSIKAIPTAKKYLSVSPVKAAIALASLRDQSIDKSRLMQFGEIVLHGFSSGEQDSAGIVLRNALVANRGFSASGTERELCVRLSQACLYAFLNKKPIRRVPKHDELIWPRIKGGAA